MATLTRLQRQSFYYVPLTRGFASTDTFMERSTNHTHLAFESKSMRPTLLFALLIAIIVCFVDLHSLLDPLPQPGSVRPDSPDFNFAESSQVEAEEKNGLGGEPMDSSPFSSDDSDSIALGDVRLEPNVASIPTSIEPSERREIVR